MAPGALFMAGTIRFTRKKTSSIRGAGQSKSG